MTKLVLTWDEYFKLCDDLVKQIKNDRITDIVSISRGGLIPAQYIAYKSRIRRVHNVGMITYSDMNHTQFEESDTVIYQKVTELFDRSHRILIIDDIADSGKTIHKCKMHHPSFNDAEFVKVCTLQYKPKSSIVKPDYYAQVIDDDTWIVYPYDLE
jgi:hypoxanthine phosphoribosyltransferase